MSADDFWDRYWAHGCLHSCANAFSGNYEGAILERWEHYASGLPAGTTVVDLGTGNGAVAAILARVSRERGLDLAVHGVDLADIDPLRTVVDAEQLFAGVTFHPRTSATAMPFADGSVGAVVGQYALEYTPRAEALAEVARVLGPGGEAAFVMHHERSIVLETTREELAHTELVLGADGVFATADRLLARMAAAGPAAEREREAFNRAAAEVSASIQASRFPDLLQSVLGHLGALLDQLPRSGPGATREALAAVRGEFEANRERLLDLAGAALDGGSLEDLQALARSTGLAAEPAELVRHDPQRLMGWWQRFRKPA